MCPKLASSTVHYCESVTFPKRTRACRNILRRNPHQHPLLYLKGVKHKELVAVLNFMYQGEVNVAQEELNSFLAVAEELKVKGENIIFIIKKTAKISRCIGSKLCFSLIRCEQFCGVSESVRLKLAPAEEVLIIKI